MAKDMASYFMDMDTGPSLQSSDCLSNKAVLQ